MSKRANSARKGSWRASLVLWRWNEQNVNVKTDSPSPQNHTIPLHSRDQLALPSLRMAHQALQKSRRSTWRLAFGQQKLGSTCLRNGVGSYCTSWTSLQAYGKAIVVHRVFSKRVALPKRRKESFPFPHILDAICCKVLGPGNYEIKWCSPKTMSLFWPHNITAVVLEHYMAHHCHIESKVLPSHNQVD